MMVHFAGPLLPLQRGLDITGVHCRAFFYTLTLLILQLVKALAITTFIDHFELKRKRTLRNVQ
jgi:hypothetical protein